MCKYETYSKLNRFIGTSVRRGGSGNRTRKEIFRRTPRRDHWKDFLDNSVKLSPVNILNKVLDHKFDKLFENPKSKNDIKFEQSVGITNVVPEKTDPYPIEKPVVEGESADLAFSISLLFDKKLKRSLINPTKCSCRRCLNLFRVNQRVLTTKK
ncbi:hypothetical protein HA402_007712 [Bradysia odoriphaga]|nr:hypothetical protein HA402_007712 [Bradysia odoriphaga]